MPSGGFPHSETSGSTAAHASPELFAVYRVLLRHLTPRHPPCALVAFDSCVAENLVLSRYVTSYVPSRLSCYALVKVPVLQERRWADGCSISEGGQVAFSRFAAGIPLCFT
jgi:hypothetical protein